MIQVFDSAASEENRRALWKVCQSANWYFGYLPGGEDNSQPFWRMDLSGEKAADLVWQQLKPQCEVVVHERLELIRQYANGHTYGLGGEPHRDDSREGTYTLLYYPMPEWAPSWHGETVFYRGGEGRDKPQPTAWHGFEVERTVRVVPNRAVLFDARLDHEGRAPSRSCRELRVSVAYKLQIV